MKWRCSMDNSFNAKLLNEVKQSYQKKRMRAEEECNELISTLNEDTQFADLYKTYNSAQLKLLRAEYEQEKQNLQQDITSLQYKLNSLLSKKHLSLSSLTPKYDCPICNDTGIVNGKLCNCIKKELTARKNQKLNTYLAFKTFTDCNEANMSSQDKKVRDILQKWANSYPNITKININLMGAPGTGKTFLLECVANRLIELNHSVCFKTAFEFNELARLYHIGKSYDYSTLLDAEVLIIDDLGSEPMLNNVTKQYLYNLINIRQMHSRPTLISTNLSLDDLLDRYDERIFSRLVNKALSININLTGTDKRIN